ncbi:MAG: thioredoxin domain-containing protein [Flavobacteriales bacterium]|jgi:hypothetical protein|tara:strand:+ start:387 stop:629 length:243 start_codon:yes stop_codon:yes gene_type:complete
MDIVMIKQEGCNPCTMFEPTAKKIAEEHSLGFRTVMDTELPENVKLPYFPFFFLYDNGEIKDQWGGTSDRKMVSVIKRNA